MRHILGGACLLGMALLSQPALAGDPLIDGARLCTQYFPEKERLYGIPNHLLAAISSAESGRWHDGLGMPLPWPWTINVEGKGYYFNSKEEAIAQTSALLRSGHQSIDVGCMQVNLMHHPYAFASLNDAFDPAHNVEYGARFLRTNYEEMGDWVKATAAYHSRTPYYGQQYLALIEKSWDRIVAKVEEARQHQGMMPVAAADKPNFRDASFKRSTLASASPPSAMHPISQTHGVRVIEVKNGAARNRADVLVIHPQDNSPIKVADAVPTASETSPTMTGTADSSPHRVTIDSHGQSSDVISASPMAVPSATTSTNFVFTN